MLHLTLPVGTKTIVLTWFIFVVCAAGFLTLLAFLSPPHAPPCAMEMSHTAPRLLQPADERGSAVPCPCLSLSLCLLCFVSACVCCFLQLLKLLSAGKQSVD